MSHALFITVLACSILVASGAFSPFQNCGIIKLREDFKCIMKMIEFQADYTSFLENSVTPKAFRGLSNSCDDIQRCYSTMECKKYDKEIIRYARMTRAYCYKLSFLRNNQ